MLAAPLVSMTLADLGAKVIKVERPDVGDDTRAWGPPWAETGASTYYVGLNRGKRSIALDLTDEHDLGLARKLSLNADIVVENFRTGLMEEFGLGYEDLAAVNPRLIYCSISGFGQSGPAANLPGYDLLIQAMSGLMSITGHPGDVPTKVGSAVTDMAAGLYATIGVLAALRHRTTTGRGQKVEVSLFDAALNALLNQGSAFVNAEIVPTAQGNRHPSIAPYEAFRAADRDFILAAANDRLWDRTCAAIGRDDLAADERYQTNPRRRANVEALVAQLSITFTTRPADHWIQLLRSAGVPAGPINRIDEAFAWAAASGLEPTQGFEESDLRTVRAPIRLSAAQIGARRPPPVLDQHGTELRSWLEQL